MSASWRSWLRGYEALDERRFKVPLHGERSQVVWCEERASEGLTLWSIVLGRAECEASGIGLEDAWHNNRLSDLVSFKMDEKGRLVGEVYLPPFGVTQQEWRLATETLAKTCDRLEYVLTGSDRQ